MALFRTKYAAELAVLSTWLCALLPWSVTFLRIETVSVVFIRFVPLRFLYIIGATFPGRDPLKFVWEVPGFVNSTGVTNAAYVWLAGSVLVLVAVLLSVVYYLDEDRVERLPVDPVRLLGVLLLLSGVVLSAATVLLWDHQAGTTVPIGVLFSLALGTVLCFVEREPRV